MHHKPMCFPLTGRLSAYVPVAAAAMAVMASSGYVTVLTFATNSGEALDWRIWTEGRCNFLLLSSQSVIMMALWAFRANFRLGEGRDIVGCSPCKPMLLIRAVRRTRSTRL